MTIRSALLGSTIALAAAPMAFAQETGERGRDGQLSIIYWQAPSTLNPYLSGGTKEVESASLVIEPLIRFDTDGEMVPWLIDEIPTIENGGVSEDLTSVTYTLSEGIQWSDGTPLTAEDAVFTYEYCTHPEGGCAQSSYFDGVASVEAVDDRTIRVTFTEPKPFPYTAFVGSESPIIQKAQFQDCLGARAPECTDANFGPIGTGPYKVADFRPNDVIQFEANENFREEGKPAFASILFKGGGDAAAAARSVLETGEFDYAWNLQVDPTILQQMEDQGNGEVMAAFGTSVERLHMNQTNADPSLPPDQRSVYMDGENPHPFLTDPKVGQALSMAIDRALIVDIGYGEGGQPTCNVLPAPELYASTANDDCLTVDMEGAKALLDEAGWTDTDGDGNPRQGRPEALGELPDLDQRGAPGHAGHRQAGLGRARRRDGAAQRGRLGVLRRRSVEPRHLPEVLRRHRDVHQQLLGRGSGGLHGQLDLLADAGARQPVAGREHPALLRPRVRCARGRDDAHGGPGAARRARQADERHAGAVLLDHPHRLPGRGLGALERPRRRPHERLGQRAVEHQGLVSRGRVIRPVECLRAPRT